MAAEAQAGEAACLPYVESRLKSSLKLKDDAWQRFLESEYRCAPPSNARWTLLFWDNLGRSATVLHGRAGPPW